MQVVAAHYAAEDACPGFLYMPAACEVYTCLNLDNSSLQMSKVQGCAPGSDAPDIEAITGAHHQCIDEAMHTTTDGQTSRCQVSFNTFCK